MNKRIIGMVVVLLLAACGREPEQAEPPLDLDAGRAIAEQECSGCHAVDGRGLTAEIPNLAAQPMAYLVDAMHAYADGRRHHAALQDLISGLSDAEIRNIAGWYSSQPPVPPAETPPVREESSYSEGREFAAACTECHGEQGFSTTPGVPSLAGQQPIYLIVSTQEYAGGERGHAEKEAMLAELDQVDIEKMAMYFAAQVPPQREPPPFGDPAAGEALSAVCGRCHGARGVSHDGLVPTLAGQEPNYLVAAITAYRDHEREHEDMITDKTDAEIEDIAAYYSVQRLGTPPGQEASIEGVAAKCDRCHGPAAGKSTMVVPSLNGQKREYLIRAMQEYRDADRGSSMMHKMSSGYSDETIEALADWYAGQPPR